MFYFPHWTCWVEPAFSIFAIFCKEILFISQTAKKWKVWMLTGLLVQVDNGTNGRRLRPLIFQSWPKKTANTGNLSKWWEERDVTETDKSNDCEQFIESVQKDGNLPLQRGEAFLNIWCRKWGMEWRASSSSSPAMSLYSFAAFMQQNYEGFASQILLPLLLQTNKQQCVWRTSSLKQAGDEVCRTQTELWAQWNPYRD